MTVWSFWLPALAASVLVVGLVVLGLLRGSRQATEVSDRAREMRLYADQLTEIERDRERGLVAPDEADRLRAETARRLLDADKRADVSVGRSPAGMRAVALAAVVAVPLVSGFLYLTQGAPDYPDVPLDIRIAQATEMRAARPSQLAMQALWEADPARPAAPEAEPQYLALMAQLREAIAARPGDQQGLRLLAVNEGNLGNYAASTAAWLRLIDAQGPDAPVADLVSLAESMALATGGLISPEAEVVLERILSRDPVNGTARYYLGLMFAQTGRPDLTFRLWRGLLEDSEPDDPWVPAIRATITDLAEVAGVRYTLPPPMAGGRGPSAADMQAAADMTEAERQEMIGGMVERLSARLAASGGPAQEWAQLIGALGVLGQTDRARAIWAEARLVFADSAADLALIDAAGRAQGFAN